MPLRIWLPLNNSYENRGIDGSPVTTGGVFETPGKLSAYCWRSSARISVPYTYGSTERLSVCMWVKPNSASAWTSVFGWGNTSTRANRIEVSATGGSEYRFFGSNDCLVANNAVATTDMTNAVWHHFAMVADGTNVKFYLDGALSKTLTQKSQVSATFDGTNTFYFGGYSDTFNGYYNDVRVYDHALSQKEVTELAKGMMLHLPMYAGYPGIGSNLCSGWEAMQSKSVGQYYTSLITDTNFFGLKVGDTYTYRVKMTAPSTKGIKARVQYYTDGSTRTGPTSSITVAAGTTGYSYLTDTITEAKRAYSRMELLITNANTSVTSSDTVYVGEVKLERGSTPTPWCPNGSSSDYMIKDCSGYQNSIGITGTVPTEISDGPRYGSSARFDGADACLWPIPDPIKSTTTEFTISVWFKTTTTSGNQCIWNGRSSSSAGSEAVGIFLINNTIRVDDSVETSSATISANTWYHLAVTWKSGGNKIVYLNGVQKTSVAVGNLTKSNTKASIGRSSVADSLTQNYFSGQMSDFRIYATALTAAQIKELYDAPISVANTGACLSEQFTEGATGISFAKTGVVSCNGISSLPGKYDPEVLIEPDGSCWAHIGHHADPTTYKFASGDPFATGVWKDARRFLDASYCDLVDKWEFLIVQKADASATTYRYRWSQTKNPNTAAFADVAAASITKKGAADGYTDISSTYGGIYKKNSNTYYSANTGSSGSWWGAIGSWSEHQGGIPGYNAVVVKDGGFLDLYIRIDNVTFSSGRTGCSLDKGGKGVLSPEFVEQ